MKIVVTGATSFIGTASVRRFLLDGQDVFAVIRPGSKNASGSLAGGEGGRGTDE